MGTRAAVPAPANFTDPKIGFEKGASFRVNVIFTVFVSPTPEKLTIEGLTVAVTPGTEIVARYEPGLTAVSLRVTVWEPTSLPIAIDGEL
jgi:hypothetical protein